MKLESIFQIFYKPAIGLTNFLIYFTLHTLVASYSLSSLLGSVKVAEAGPGTTGRPVAMATIDAG